MGKRRTQFTSSDPLSETHQRIAREVEAALSLAPQLTEGSEPTLPNLKDLNNSELESLNSTISAAKSQSISALENWESYMQHLQHALDATLLLISLKSEPETKKRRRTAAIPDLGVGDQVAFRIPAVLHEEWILCEIVRINPDGITYEVRDPEPDEEGNPGRQYVAKQKDIIPIPAPGSQLPSYPPGTQVLAQYPETTAFYRAEVLGTKGTKCKLIFEGEEDDYKQTEVERYLVLKPPPPQ